jgi:hypothetical protein
VSALASGRWRGAAQHLKAHRPRCGCKLPIVRGKDEVLVLGANQQGCGQVDGIQRTNEGRKRISRAFEHGRVHRSDMEAAQDLAMKDTMGQGQE